MMACDALWLRSEQEGMLLPVKPRMLILGSESYLCTYAERIVVSDHKKVVLVFVACRMWVRECVCEQVTRDSVRSDEYRFLQFL